jgi:anti-anti-sigma factor
MSELTVTSRETELWVRYTGEIIFDVVEDLKTRLEPVWENGSWKTMVFDLEPVEFLDSSGIGFFVVLNNRCAQTGRKLILFRPRPQIRKTLALVNMLHYFCIADDADDVDANMLD